jgi:2-hydroxychromene-2-carboxylate isomerase
MKLEFFFDCSSPFTYLGFHNLQILAREVGASIIWRPILVGGVFNAVNPSVYARRDSPVPAKEIYNSKDIQDWARVAGLRIKFPPCMFPVNSVKVMRGCIFLEPSGKQIAFAEAAFRAYWSEDLDISVDSVLADLCRPINVKPETFFAGISQQWVKDGLRANTEELIARGGFGSPTFFVNGTDMYFGNDRLPLVREVLLRERSSGSATSVPHVIAAPES